MTGRQCEASAARHRTRNAGACVSSSSGRPTVLFVETHEAHRERGRSFLQADCAQTFRVVTCASVDEALESVRQAKENGDPLVLLVVRHVEDEQALTALLREAKRGFPGVRVILYDEQENPVYATEGKREGLVDYSLTEPWDAPEISLEPVVRDALRAWETTSRSADLVEVVGDQWHPRCHDLKDLLARHRVAYRYIEEDTDEAHSRPLRIVFPDGEELVDPTDEDLAQKLGFSTSPEESFYDLIIVGGGPAGLAAAVYASSEGLRTVIVERDVPGGQAGSSALIENYLGFPDGLPGAELASRAVAQAEKFGTEILLTKAATALRDDRGYRVVVLDDGTEIVGHSVLLAMGVAYTRFKAEGAERLTGSGVYYGAAAAEAARFRDGNVCLLGSGNSAAQAALLLARYVKSLTIITIDDSLETTMSQYLVDRIKTLSNVTLITQTSVVEVKGTDKVETLVIERVDSKEREELKTDALFVWIGAKPRTDWLADTIVRDEQGFIVTGRDLRRPQLAAWPEDRWPMPLESSMEGVFVAGDVRHDSVKRVGSAVGEGAMAVQLVHNYLRAR